MSHVKRWRGVLRLALHLEASILQRPRGRDRFGRVGHSSPAAMSGGTDKRTRANGAAASVAAFDALDGPRQAGPTPLEQREHRDPATPGRPDRRTPQHPRAGRAGGLAAVAPVRLPTRRAGRDGGRRLSAAAARDPSRPAPSTALAPRRSPVRRLPRVAARPLRARRISDLLPHANASQDTHDD
jgi:hypothetical protein